MAGTAPRACHDGAALRDPAAYTRMADVAAGGWCRAVPGGGAGAVCLVAPDDDSAEDARHRMSYRIGGDVRHAWDVDANGVAIPAVFTVEHVDLDGDGAGEVLVGVMASESNGLGVQRWRLFALTPEGRPLGELDVHDYGALSGLFQLPGQRGCQLLASTWEYGSEPARGDGTYVRGRWLRIAPEGWSPVPGQPVVRRRFLFSFERERFSLPRPLHWFRKAEPCPTAASCPRIEPY